MVSEILPFDQDWSEVEILPSATPYGSNFPGSMCSVLLNSTTVMVMGGFQSGALSSARLLDLNNFVWTDVADMINGKHTHACTLTAEGQVFQSSILGRWSSPILKKDHGKSNWRKERKNKVSVQLDQDFYTAIFILLSNNLRKRNWEKKTEILDTVTFLPGYSESKIVF